MGKNHVIIEDDDIIFDDGERFTGTHGLWELITSKRPDWNTVKWDKLDEENYVNLLLKTNILHRNYDPTKSSRSNKSYKWRNILSHIWYTGKFPKKEYQGKGVVFIPSDPNALLERLDLLLASQDAGHTGVGNELVSICDELKRQGVLDTNTYKKINSIIKK